MVFLTKRHDLNNSSPLLFINLLQFSAVSSAINKYMHIKICLSVNRNLTKYKVDPFFLIFHIFGCKLFFYKVWKAVGFIASHNMQGGINNVSLLANIIKGPYIIAHTQYFH